MIKRLTTAFLLSILFIFTAFEARASDYVTGSDERVEDACDAVVNRLIEWYGKPDEWDKFPVYFRGYAGNGIAGYTQYSGGGVSEVVVYFPLEKTVGGTLDHELTHAFLKYYLDRRSLDLFINEGTAQNSEIARINELRRAVYQQYERGEFWALNDLIGRNRYDDRLRMYRQSYSVVEMLIRLGGRDYFGAFLKDFVGGGDINASLYKFYGLKNVDALEETWLEYLNNGQEF